MFSSINKKKLELIEKIANALNLYVTEIIKLQIRIISN